MSVTLKKKKNRLKHVIYTMNVINERKIISIIKMVFNDYGHKFPPSCQICKFAMYILTCEKYMNF